ncbi:Ig-like domain-containing protein [uncultured Dokdonia sp.]|uniref:Ig-like domain-containing protein n=1 Tax=uncultured Dokdonia sp. TaxID=575653 RepID=UPI00261F27BA|nr:Ig-like domain-containing protein [uncultured Dokdonia sp.]
MSFFNRYTGFSTRKVIEFSDGIYILGQSNDGLNIAKLNFEGDILWSKSYFNENLQYTEFQDGIDIGTGIVFLYKSSVYTDNPDFKTGMILIDYSGNILWNNIYYQASNHPNSGGIAGARNIITRRLIELNGAIFIIIQDRIAISGEGHDGILDIFIYKIDFNGNAINQKRISFNHALTFIINATSFNNSIALFGEDIIDYSSTSEKKHAAIFIINTDLTTINRHILQDVELSDRTINFRRITNLSAVENGKVYISGMVNELSLPSPTITTNFTRTFIARLDINTFNVEKMIFDESNPQLSSFLEIYQNQVYFYSVTDDSFRKFTTNLNHIDRFRLGSNSHDILHPQIFNNKILGIYNGGSVYNTFALDLNLNSCLTQQLQELPTTEFQNNVELLSDQLYNFQTNSEAWIGVSHFVSDKPLIRAFICEFYRGIDLNQSTITANPTEITANGTSTSTIIVQLKDSEGQIVTEGGQDITIIKNDEASAAISNTTDNNNGTYQATLTSSQLLETVTLSFYLNNENNLSINTALVVIGSLVNLEQSTITASPTEIMANGSSQSLITVQLNDDNGEPVTEGEYVTILNLNDAGTLENPSGMTGENGVYTTLLTSSTTIETALLGFSVENVGQGIDTATVEFIEPGSIITITDTTAIQSQHLYLQAAGSNGQESTKGRHLRWALRGALGEKHLPKGDYATTNVNFNKPKDYVRIYRAAYKKKTTTLDFIVDTPEVVDNTNYLWIYRIEDKDFSIRFNNTILYNQIVATINPLSQPTAFLEAYGDQLIEIESASGLFFAARCYFEQGISSVQKTIKMETLSVEADTAIASKIVSNRRSLQGSQVGSSLRLLCENGKAVRGEISGVTLSSIDFEFYDTLIDEINTTTGWDELGDFALTLDTNTAYEQLEPSHGDVHGVWQRFNDEAYVNINNYHDRWEGAVETGDRNIKQVVDKYISLSNEASNPTAVESIPLGNDPNDPTDAVSISNLDLLAIAANDYHVARLLGLGTLDINTPESFTTKDATGKQITVQAYKSPLYVYVAEYYTVADLEDGQGERDVHHLFMSLPTSDATSRLPLAVNLNNIEPGLSIGNIVLTDEEGYTHDGLSRYVKLYNENLPEDQIDVPFFNSNEYINLSAITNTVYGGLEYKMDNEQEWRKPELPKEIRYENAVPTGEEPHFESRFLMIPSTDAAYYTHRQRVSGTHHYSSYGINWFSRATASGTTVSISTELRPKNPLLPPSNTAAHLIRSESPLLLTSASEQDRLGGINPNGDRTLIRLSFDYHSYHELKNYQIPVDDSITNSELIADTTSVYSDNDEIFAENIEVFFRNEVPNNIIGKALTVTDHNSDETLSIIQTGDYFIASTGQTVTPTVAPGTEANYIGGFFTMGTDNYLIQEVEQATQGPQFTVYKKEITESIVNGGMPSNQTDGELVSPEIIGDGYFMAFENMQTPDNWGNPNPYAVNVKVGENSNIHREVITLVDDDGIEDRYLEKTRGIWSDESSNHTTIESLDENGNVTAQNTGLYKITFHGIQLHEHSQYNENGVSVEWSGGIIRLFTEATMASGIPTGSRKVLPVLKIENVIRVGETVQPYNDLVVYVQDPAFDSTDTGYDAIQTGNNIEANFYPGYKVYLYADATFGLTESNILPDEGEGMKYSIFGFRSQDTDDDFVSKMSIPAVMYAQELIEALPPEQPEGGVYATRPDFYGRSTYTLTTKYQHKPHGVLFYRANDEAILNSLYEKATVREIRTQLALLGGNNEEYLNNRWENFLNFGQLEMDGDYKVYPPADVSEDGYKFPNPDKVSLYEWANTILGELGQPLITESPGDLAVGDPKILNFVKGFIYNAFVPLTEIPILYQYLNDSEYQPIAKKQVVYDRNGHTLPPVDPKTLGPDDEAPEFDMAPMMKIIGEAPNETLFTDFTLDGTSNNLYFYGAKELSTQMKMSPFSPFLGPVKLVNTNAPEQPEIKRIMPVLENQILGITPKVQLEINAYSEAQNIQRLTVYRATNKLDAQSVRTMNPVKVIDLTQEQYAGQSVLKVYDDFSDLTEVPYGQGLYYRITVSRAVTYIDKEGVLVDDFAPSKASKIVATMMVEVNTPSSPELSYEANINSYDDTTNNDSTIVLSAVRLSWEKQVYNAKYHLYKMNSQGNWYKIYELQTNDNQIEVSLSETDAESPLLLVQDGEGTNRYHHFKVITENTSGMLSTEEKILTLPDTVIPNNGVSFPTIGVSSMDIGTTFTIN